MGDNQARALAERLVRAIAAGDAGAFDAAVAETATLRVWRWDGREAHRPGRSARERLASEWAAWDRPVLDIVSACGEGERASLEYRVWTTENRTPVEHNRVLLVTERDGKAEVLDLYCAHPVPTCNHAEHIAERARADGDIERLIDARGYPLDTRRQVPSEWRSHHRLDIEMMGDRTAHPGANLVRRARFTGAEADRRIAEVVEFHRQRDLGFSWHVFPEDTPRDLPQRLERHGMVLAGTAVTMTRRLDDMDGDGDGDGGDGGIAINPDVVVEAVAADDEAAIEASLQIVATCFQWPDGQADRFRDYWFDRMQNPAIRRRDISYMAYLDGQPVAWAQLVQRAGLANLEGGATLPAYRDRKVYATLLRHRLRAARELGHDLVTVEAQPMSRRVLERYGFEVTGDVFAYAWMPVLDMDVIRTLIQQDDNQPDPSD